MRDWREELRGLDTLSKFVVIMASIMLAYILVICLIIPLALTPSHSFSEEYLLSFSTPEHRHLNLIAFLLALSFGSAFAIFIRKQDEDSHHERRIIKNILSEADRQVMDVLEEVDEITQDSLMFRLAWSRAKISTILTNLERRNLIQRRREGKTYAVFLPKKRGKK